MPVRRSASAPHFVKRQSKDLITGKRKPMSADQPEAMETDTERASWQMPASHSALQLSDAGASGSGTQQQVMSPRNQAVQERSKELRNAAVLSMMAGPGFVVNNLTQIMMNSESNTALQHLIRVE